MDEARKLHFAQVCADSFPTISATLERWRRTVNDPKATLQDKQKAAAFLKDTEGLAKRTTATGVAEPIKVLASRQQFLSGLSPTSLYAQLQSRLMVNMAGGVKENAGLCLDRFGLPYIPGSAVKGCARRAALATLHEWCEAGGKPEHKPTGPDNPLAACCSAFPTPAEMLAAIARVFGWCEQDWSDRFDSSDYHWACGDHWQTTRAETLALLGSAPAPGAADCAPAVRSGPASEGSREGGSANGRGARAPRLKDFAGSVSFLPAYPLDLGKTGKVDGLPLEVPPLGKLELDVVTVHHKHYYAEPAEPKDVPHSHERWQRWKRDHEAWEREWGTAPDIEEPVPNVFPAVAPSHVFAFALAPLRGADAQLIQHARTWLATGLQTFGLGAKTNAGYGWFDCSQRVQDTVAGIFQQLTEKHRKEQEEAEAKRRAEEEKQAAERAEKERLAKVPPHEKFRVEYSKLADEPFATQAKKYHEMTDDQRHGFVLALKERRETAKRWAKNKPDKIKPWQEHAQKLQPPIQLP
jgi:CRISPR/Cas system CMR subunit Cmr6 (Cas7 group RAMP superfamily)